MIFVISIVVVVGGNIGSNCSGDGIGSSGGGDGGSSCDSCNSGVSNSS
jgi:hypothetical protein